MKRMNQNSTTLLVAAMIMVVAGCATHQRAPENVNAGWSRWEKSAGGNGHYYKAVPASSGIEWTRAAELARQQGGYLATITSARENAFVFKLIHSPEFFADFNGAGPVIGAFQPEGAVEPDGGWRWATGESWNYANWYSGEPNNYKSAGTRGEDGVIFYSNNSRTPSATWADISRGDSHTGGYVIERDK